MKEKTTPDTSAKSVGIWIRVSTEDQAKGESPEHHEKRARFYAEAKGWKVREVYHLEGVSGKAVSDHPEAQRMLADVKRGRITGLIFSKLARLARNTRELLDFADLFRAAGADLISLQESIDTSTPAGRLFYTMIAAMAQWEREEIASRVAASVVVRAKLGKPLGGQAPYGYRWVDRKLVPNPDEAPVRKRMYDLFLEHRRKKAVAKILNDAGLRTRNGSKFSDTTVARLLADPTAKGEHRLNYTSSEGDGKAWKLKPETEWQYLAVEAIVSPELWDRCNSILSTQTETRKRPLKRAVQLFAGLTFCGCGGRMNVPSNNPKYTCDKCRNKIPTDDLEAIYVEQLKGTFVDRTKLVAHLERANEATRDREELLKTKERELEKASREIDRVYKLYVDEQLSSDQFGEFFRPLETRKKALEAEVAKEQAQVALDRVQGLSADEILSEAGDLYRRWPQLTRDERRRVVESITEKIVVGAGSDAVIEIQLAHLPSSEELTERQRTLTDSSRRRA